MSADATAAFEIDVLRNDRSETRLRRDDVTALCTAALRAAGIEGGHVSVELVTPERIQAVNAQRRGKDRPTDVLSFPMDGEDRIDLDELGDVLICPEHTADVREAIVHGALHLAGMDHETDDGEMLALQAEILGRVPEPR